MNIYIYLFFIFLYSIPDLKDNTMHQDTMYVKKHSFSPPSLYIQKETKQKITNMTKARKAIHSIRMYVS